jgi:hypothetical protein
MAATTHRRMTPTPAVATAAAVLSERRPGAREDATQHAHRQNNAFTSDTHGVSPQPSHKPFDPMYSTQFVAIGGHNSSLIAG